MQVCTATNRKGIYQRELRSFYIIFSFHYATGYLKDKKTSGKGSCGNEGGFERDALI